MKHAGSKEELHHALAVQGKQSFIQHACRSNLSANVEELQYGIPEGHPLWEEAVHPAAKHCHDQSSYMP